jgi:hypothetical protein
LSLVGVEVEQAITIPVVQGAVALADLELALGF